MTSTRGGERGYPNANVVAWISTKIRLKCRQGEGGPKSQKFYRRHWSVAPIFCYSFPSHTTAAGHKMGECIDFTVTPLRTADCVCDDWIANILTKVEIWRERLREGRGRKKPICHCRVGLAANGRPPTWKSAEKGDVARYRLKGKWLSSPSGYFTHFLISYQSSQRLRSGFLQKSSVEITVWFASRIGKLD